MICFAFSRTARVWGKTRLDDEIRGHATLDNVALTSLPAINAAFKVVEFRHRAKLVHVIACLLQHALRAILDQVLEQRETLCGRAR